jgi:hypothetical protein
MQRAGVSRAPLRSLQVEGLWWMRALQAHVAAPGAPLPHVHFARPIVQSAPLPVHLLTTSLPLTPKKKIILLFLLLLLFCFIFLFYFFGLRVVVVVMCCPRRHFKERVGQQPSRKEEMRWRMLVRKVKSAKAASGAFSLAAMSARLAQIV